MEIDKEKTIMSNNTLMSENAFSRRNFFKLVGVTTTAMVLGGSVEMVLPEAAFAASGGTTCYLIKNKNCTCYTSSNLKKKKGTIYGSDLVTVLEVHDGSCRVSYPTSKGKKQGWIKTSAILTKTGGSTVTSTGKITTYTRPGGSGFGYIAKKDKVKVLGASGKYTQVKYPAGSSYKYAWVKTSDKNKYLAGGGKSNDKSSSKATSMTNALYGISVAGSKITCGFDGYKNTPGKHEGIDFKYGVGKSVYSLLDGKVIRVTSGKRGSGGLSQIAIYNSSLNKTMLYLHACPCVKKGQSVKRGQKIATEDWRGVSSKSGAHTHVEMRPGKKTSAAKSVNDYTLENPNPTSFYKSQGYSVK